MHCRPRPFWIALLCLLALARPAAARVKFSDAPHLLLLPHRQQIVLFASGPLDGAMATRWSDGSIDVMVPNAVLDGGLVGRDFSGPPVGPGRRATSVSLETSDDGGVRIRIRPAGDVARAIPRVDGGPDRLTIDLLPVAEGTPGLEDAAAPGLEAGDGPDGGRSGHGT